MLNVTHMYNVKTGVQNMYYMKCTCISPRINVMKERLYHLCFCCCVQVEFVSIHNCKVAPVVSLQLYTNATLATAIQGTSS